jgi:hypothetical protein
MSKKLYTSQKWKNYLRSRQKAQLRNARRAHKRRYLAIYRKVERVRKRYYTLVAPTVLSLVNSPEAAMRFFANIEFYAMRYHLNLDLSPVVVITTDAIAALVAALRGLDANVRGNLPENSDAQQILLESGFFDYVHSTTKLPKMKRGFIRQEGSFKVEPLAARELVQFGTKGIYGNPQRCPAAYTTLIECMANTHNHASGKHETKHEKWYATVFIDTSRKKICLTFVDTGVGIFRSVQLGTVRKMYKAVGFRKDTDILRDMLQGKVPSSTMLPYRGMGLPSINRLATEKRISSLVIIANDVFANVSSGDFKMLQTEFHGTLVYWEI